MISTTYLALGDAEKYILVCDRSAATLFTTTITTINVALLLSDHNGIPKAEAFDYSADATFEG